MAASHRYAKHSIHSESQTQAPARLSSQKYLKHRPNRRSTLNELVVSMVCLFCITLLHELGHATAAYRSKIEPAEIGAGIYFLFPVFYADVSEVWRLLPKRRLMVNLAGVYMQLLVNVALIIFFLVVGVGQHHEFLVKIVMANTIVIGANLIPFFKLDGYWLVADFLNIPDLQKSSSDHLKSTLLYLAKRRNERPELNPTLLCYAIGQVSFALAATSVMVIFFRNSFIELMNISKGELGLSEAISRGPVRYILFVLITCILCAKIYSLLLKLRKRAAQ